MVMFHQTPTISSVAAWCVGLRRRPGALSQANSKARRFTSASYLMPAKFLTFKTRSRLLDKHISNTCCSVTKSVHTNSHPSSRVSLPSSETLCFLRPAVLKRSRTVCASPGLVASHFWVHRVRVEHRIRRTTQYKQRLMQ